MNRVRMHRVRSWARALSFTLVAACSSAVNGTGVPPATCTFKNPIATGADPWVTRDGSYYYLAESRDNGIYIYKSTSLTSIKQNPVKVWTAPATGWNETNIWAPELHHINGLWYIYYAGGRRHPNGSDAPFTSQRAGVLQSVADDPQGAVRLPGRSVAARSSEPQSRPLASRRHRSLIVRMAPSVV